jgi:hypothetical protein
MVTSYPRENVFFYVLAGDLAWFMEPYSCGTAPDFYYRFRHCVLPSGDRTPEHDYEMIVFINPRPVKRNAKEGKKLPDSYIFLFPWQRGWKSS